MFKDPPIMFEVFEHRHDHGGTLDEFRFVSLSVVLVQGLRHLTYLFPEDQRPPGRGMVLHPPLRVLSIAFLHDLGVRPVTAPLRHSQPPSANRPMIVRAARSCRLSADRSRGRRSQTSAP